MIGLHANRVLLAYREHLQRSVQIAEKHLRLSVEDESEVQAAIRDELATLLDELVEEVTPDRESVS